MSQHGSGFGGYGGGPPAGGPPPGGAPPGYPPGGGGPGYPPGGGGPGYPPGGGGGGPGYPPGGGGPGYPPGGGGGGYPPAGGYPPNYGPPQGGPPPGYGAPGGGYPPGGPPPKKSNALLWVGLGCGSLILLSAVGTGIAVYMAKRATDSALAAASSLAAPLTPPGTGGTLSSGTDSSGAPLGGACAKAAECCRKIVQKTSPGAQNEAGCLSLKQLPEANCQLPLTTYQKSAQLLGVSCD